MFRFDHVWGCGFRSVSVLGGVGLVVTVVLYLSLASCTGRQTSEARPAYAGSAACLDCHQEESRLWQGSFHDRAMDHAGSETVLGDFDNVTIEDAGSRMRFYRSGDRYMVETDGVHGRRDTLEIKYVFGVYPLQQYLVEISRGRVQALTTAWDSRDDRWFSLYPGEHLEAGDWLHWTGGAMNWNYMCAECHTTDLRKNFDLPSRTYRTTAFSLDVSCESCHGPGERHVALAREAESAGRSALKTTGLTRDRRRHWTPELEVCAPCHARRRPMAPGFVPGDAFLDHYAPELLESALYYPDGQIKDEVFEYGSFLQSLMARRNVTCSNCHDPHSLKVRFKDNRLCTQCHVASVYDGANHTFHPVRSRKTFVTGEKGDGTFCVDCHMPVRTYMGVDPRRDHSFVLPRPDLTVALGVPNACSGCHTDRSPAWAAEKITAWYGPVRRHEPHFAYAFSAGRRQDPEAEPALIALVDDTSRAGIVRATATTILGAYSSANARLAVREAAKDSDPLVRMAAVRAMENASDAELYEVLAPLTTDPLRLVRTEAARVLAHAASRVPQDHRGFKNALSEFRQIQQYLSDQPAAHLNMGVLHENMSRPDSAEAAYATAIRLDSTFVPARFNLAMLYDRQRQEALFNGNNARAGQLAQAAEQQLRVALRLSPNDAGAAFTLGLLVAEQPARLAEAANLLERAAAMDSTHRRAFYNAGLARQQLHQRERAEKLLLHAYRLAPYEIDFVNALSVFYVQERRWPEALRFTRELATLSPGDRSVAERLAYVEQSGEMK